MNRREDKSIKYNEPDKEFKKTKKKKLFAFNSFITKMCQETNSSSLYNTYINLRTRNIAWLKKYYSMTYFT